VDPVRLLWDGLNRLAAALALLPLLPPILVIAAWIRIADGKGVLFIQDRAGRDGVPFRMWKFRTMVHNAVGLSSQLGISDPFGLVEDDPRITRCGRFLRRTSLDELPQLFNVLFGQMSLVGPRPALPRELNGFDKVQRLRTRVLPGLTGLWQVSGRSDLPFDEMVRLDIAYMETRSLLNDVRIILKTVPSVLFGVGAY
jgi:lipopolysaccharide/colanic/teichoic acid biosynthesis glycosyltransferase